MTTTVADIIARGAGMSVANNTTDLTSDQTLIARVAEWERAIFHEAAQRDRYFYAQDPATSTNAASGRTLALAGLSTTKPIARIVRVTFTATGELLNRVDIEDPDAELPPRYYALGTTLYEVDTDWGPSGTKALTLGYAYRPAALSLTGDTSQALTLPDEWTHLLDNRMAAFLALKDFGRGPGDSNETARLDTLYAAALAEMLDTLDAFAGPPRRRFAAPDPPSDQGGSN